MKIAKILPIEKPTEVAVSVPGSKSYSLRALLISALCRKNFQISNLLSSDDTSAMQNCLRQIQDGKSQLDVNESGLTARFIIALACITPGEQVITGAPGIEKRPINDLVNALIQLGANIEYSEKDGFLPVRIMSSNLSNDKVDIAGNVSSQYLSALLLIAPTLENGLEINIVGEQISKPYIDITIDIMNHFGVKIENQKYKKYIIKPQSYISKDYLVEADYSSASYFYAINALANSKITIPGLNPRSKQGDKKFCDLVSTSLDSLNNNINALDFPDQAMTLAVLLAFKPGKSTITGVKSLRVKETERIKAIENELAKMGIMTESTQDTLTIYGGNPLPANIDSYGDHRIAMSFAVAATKLNRVNIFNPEVVSKTFPGFWDELSKITKVSQHKITPSNLALTGLRGTGKSTVGKILAKEFGMEFVDVDKYIEQKKKINIKTTVQKKGWEFFRKLESNAIETISKRKNTIISTGGGALLDDKNVFNLQKDGLIFMLKADPLTLSRRISRYKKLPALTNHKSVHEELKEVWEQRKQRYFLSCDFIIETENLSPSEVAKVIIGKIKR